jgi:hypothetical protein
MESEHPACPLCGSNHVASILYGLPDDSEELKRDVNAKKIVLGGCVITDDDPQWHCNECQHEWTPDP